MACPTPAIVVSDAALALKQPVGKGLYGVVHTVTHAKVCKVVTSTKYWPVGAWREVMAYGRLQAVYDGTRLTSPSPLCDEAQVTTCDGTVALMLRRGISLPCLTDVDPDVLARHMLVAYDKWSAAGLFHCDIKLDNFVLLDGTAVVIDWGMARTSLARCNEMHMDLMHTPLYRAKHCGSMEAAELYALASTIASVYTREGRSVCAAAPDVRAFVLNVLARRVTTRRQLVDAGLIAAPLPVGGTQPLAGVLSAAEMQVAVEWAVAYAMPGGFGALVRLLSVVKGRQCTAEALPYAQCVAAVALLAFDDGPQIVQDMAARQRRRSSDVIKDAVALLHAHVAQPYDLLMGNAFSQAVAQWPQSVLGNDAPLLRLAAAVFGAEAAQGTEPSMALVQRVLEDGRAPLPPRWGGALASFVRAWAPAARRAWAAAGKCRL